LIDYYRHTMSELGYQAELFISQVAGRKVDLDPYPLQLRRGEHFGPDEERLIEEIRPRLLPRYRDLPQEDLLAAGVMLRATKPDDRS
jgi:hypothetical protein